MAPPTTAQRRDLGCVDRGGAARFVDRGWSADRCPGGRRHGGARAPRCGTGPGSVRRDVGRRPPGPRVAGERCGRSPGARVARPPLLRDLPVALAGDPTARATLDDGACRCARCRRDRSHAGDRRGLVSTARASRTSPYRLGVGPAVSCCDAGDGELCSARGRHRTVRPGRRRGVRTHRGVDRNGTSAGRRRSARPGCHGRPHRGTLAPRNDNSDPSGVSDHHRICRNARRTRGAGAATDTRPDAVGGRFGRGRSRTGAHGSVRRSGCRGAPRCLRRCASRARGGWRGRR